MNDLEDQFEHDLNPVPFRRWDRIILWTIFILVFLNLVGTLLLFLI